MIRMQRFFGLMLGLLVVSVSFAQEGSIDEIKLDEFRTPSNPALSLMGATPTEIVRPKSLRQLESTLVNDMAAGDGGAAIPNDFGLEVMPAWLYSNPSVKYDLQGMRDYKWRFWRTLSASLGSVNTTVNDTLVSQIGFGLRTQLLSGRLSKTSVDKINAVSQKLAVSQFNDQNILAAVAQAEDSVSSFQSYQDFRDFVAKDIVARNGKADSARLAEAWFTFFDIQTDGAKLKDALSEQDASALIDSMYVAIDEGFNKDENATMVDSIKDLRANRYGFIWEVAAATFLDFPTGQFGYSKVPKFGAWTTLTYRTEDQTFDFIGTFRYIEDFNIENRTQNLDGGVSLVANVGNFSFTGEYLQRYQIRSIERTMEADGFDLEKTDNGWDYRATINASYRFSDKFILNYSFGKRFDFSDQVNNNLVSQLSLNVGLGSIPLKL